MRKIDWLHSTTSRQFIDHIHEIEHIEQPFTDRDILDIQEKFLCNGFQYLKSSRVLPGRKMVYDFLKSLSLYHDVACLSLDSAPLEPDITDLYSELMDGGYLNSYEPYSLDEYFIEQFYFDFVWIEATRKLLLSPWFENVKRKIISAAIDQHIPILVIAYSEE